MSESEYISMGAEAYLSRLLSYALPNDRTDAVAHELLKRYGSIDLVCSADVCQLENIEGMNEKAALLLSLAAALSSRHKTDGFALGKRHTDEEIAEYFVALFIGVSVETVYMMLLDDADRVMSVEYMGEGTVGTSDVYPRRLLECAVRRGASSVILAHNHPRGTANASADDIMATRRLESVFLSSSIILKDHYIVAERDVVKIPHI